MTKAFFLPFPVNERGTNNWLIVSSRIKGETKKVLYGMYVVEQRKEKEKESQMKTQKTVVHER